MKKIRIFKRYRNWKDIVFAAVTVIALCVTAGLLFNFERELYQLIALFCVAVASVAIFAVFNLFSGLRAAIACFASAGIMCLSFIMCAVAPAIVSANEAAMVYQCPAVERDIFKNKRVMLFVPHEDDELNVFSGVIDEYLDGGSEIWIVYMTHGDYWGAEEQRIDEAKAVAEFYGIDSRNVIFFGYGDQWLGTHIYNSEPNEVVASHSGKTATYAINGVSPYKSEDYTRANLLKDFEDVIVEYMPDTIFCIDFDRHSDHRANSLFFEEALGNVLSYTDDYAPTVYKGFGYSTGWNAEQDYYDGENVGSTKNQSGTSYMEEVNYYNWNDRVRMPVAAKSLGHVISGTTTYKAIEKHASQTDRLENAAGIINSDKIFFRRDTSSLTYKADIRVSSNEENAYKLNDFKIVDCNDVTKEYDYDILSGVWTPSDGDGAKEITVSFSSPQSLSTIRLYDSPSFSDNVLSVTITLSDGTQIEYGALNANGSATDISFETKNGINGFTVQITAGEGNYGVAEVEAYSSLPDYSADAYVKLQDTDGTFAYEYTMPGDTQYFTLYSYECSDDIADYEISTDGDITATVKDGRILVKCAAGKEGTLTVTNKENGVSDSVRITNPNSFTRAGRSFVQQLARFYNFYSRGNYYTSLFKFIKNKISG